MPKDDKKARSSRKAVTKSKRKPLEQPLDESISSTDRLEKMLSETEAELEKIQPEINKLEKHLNRLNELKQTKQKLITLKLSLKSILNNFTKTTSGLTTYDLLNISNAAQYTSPTPGYIPLSPVQKRKEALARLGTFYPDQAFSEVDQILKQKSSINYELFRAIVFNGGEATTEQIRQYLLDHQIQLPGSGKGFEGVASTEISSRVNYLIRKKLVSSVARGLFRSNLGWENPPVIESESHETAAGNTTSIDEMQVSATHG